jgi:hypothetical protein
VHAALHVVQHAAEPRRPAQRAQLIDPALQPNGGGQALLHRRGEDAVGGPQRCVVSGPQEQCRLEACRGDAGTRVAEHLERTARSKEADAVDGLE